MAPIKKRIFVGLELKNWKIIYKFLKSRDNHYPSKGIKAFKELEEQILELENTYKKSRRELKKIRNGIDSTIKEEEGKRWK